MAWTRSAAWRTSTPVRAATSTTTSTASVSTGRALTRLSRTDGTHRAIFNPSFTRYVGVWSDAATPPQVRLHRADGAEIRVIDANAVPALAQYRLSKPEFVEVRTRDGFVMDAMIIKPPDFDPSRRYPVFQLTYSGPGTASVRNQWAGSTFMYHQLLAQHGVVVWVLDNRSASGKGAESQWPVYGRLGELELQDLEDGIGWLKRQTFVDPSRIVLHGWSYGGFMTSYALTHSTQLGGRRRRRAGDGLEELRHRIYRAVHEDAAEQSGRLQAHGAAVCGRQPARPDAARARNHRRQRAHAEFRAVRLRAAAGRKIRSK